VCVKNSSTQKGIVLWNAVLDCVLFLQGIFRPRKERIPVLNGRKFGGDYEKLRSVIKERSKSKIFTQLKRESEREWILCGRSGL
jgi:hypothetical protein